MTVPKSNLMACLSIVFAALLAVTSVSAAKAQPADEAHLNLVPWPRQVSVQDGSLALTSESRIVADDESLLPLAELFAEEIAAVAGKQFKAVSGKPKAGDIVLELDPSLKDEAHTVAIEQNATVRGGSYHAVALGTATILQALKQDGGSLSLPHLSISDEPVANFRGLMLDVARKPHTIGGIKQIVDLCRLYKIRYLHLHLTDDQLWMFPSKAFPLLGTKNEGKNAKPYTLEELKDLVAYADRRSVTIIPEFDMPGHCGSLVRTMPDLFAIKDTKPYIHHASINFVKEDVMKAVETIVGEMCEVFQSSPYFHIGGDEADLALAKQNADFQAAMKEHDAPGPQELYRRFLVQMNEIVKKNGKLMIVWEGFHRGGKVKIPTDITVMAYEIVFYKPQHLVEDGYKVINASWTPLYVLKKKHRPADEIYAWNMYQFKPHGAAPDAQGIVVPPSEGVIGANMCSWEQPAEMELPSLRSRLPAMSERIWNPEAGKPFADFERRFKATDKLLDKLVE